MKKSALFLFLILNSFNLTYSFTQADGLVIQKRFDHGGGKDGYYMGDNALIGKDIYKQMWKGGYCRYITSYGSYVIADKYTGALLYTMGQSYHYYSASLQAPSCVAVNNNGLIYAGDVGKQEIQFLSNNGDSIDFKKSSPMDYPIDIYCYNGMVFAVSAINDKIYRYDSSLNPVNVYKETNYFTLREIPVAVCADNYTVYALTGNSILCHSLMTGKLISAIPLDRAIKPLDIDMDYYGNLYVLDETGYIHKYRDGRYVCSMLSPGNGDYNLNSPNGLFIDRRTGDLTVFDDTGLKSYSISTAVFSADTDSDDFAAGNGFVTNRINYSIAEDSEVSVDITDSSGQLVKTLAINEFKPTGQHSIIWNGSDSSGNPVSPGSYKVIIKAVENYSSFNTHTAVIQRTVRPAPSIRLTYLYKKAVTPSNSLLYIRFKTSDPMDISLYLERDGLTCDLVNGTFDGNGMFTYDFSGFNLEEGQYSAVLAGKTPKGRICRAETNFFINLYPLRLDISAGTPFFSPLLSNAVVDFSVSEKSTVALTLPDGKELSHGTFYPGSNRIVWNGRETNGTIYPDGPYQLTLKAYQEDVDSAASNIGTIIDATPPVLTGAVDNPYFSSTDSPGIKDKSRVDTLVNEDSMLRARVIDNHFSEAASVFDSSIASNAVQPVEWTGALSGGSQSPDGEFRFELKAADRCGNETTVYKDVVLDNNRFTEDINIQPKVTLIRTLSESENNFYWIRKYHKFLWLASKAISGNTNYITNIVISDENANNIRLLGNQSPIFQLNGISMAPDEKYVAFNTFSNYIEHVSFPDPLPPGMGDTYISPRGPFAIIDLSSETKYHTNTLFLTPALPYSYPGFPLKIAGVQKIPPYHIVVFYFLTDGSISNSLWELRKTTNPSSFISYSPNNTYLIWNNPYLLGLATIIYNLTNDTPATISLNLETIFWTSGIKFLATYTNTNQQRVLITYNISNNEQNIIYAWPVSKGNVCDISFDHKNLLLTDGKSISLFNIENSNLCTLASFNSIGGLDTPDPRKYSTFFSEDGNSVIFSGTKDGLYGIYHIDIKKSTPKNLTAELDYPNIGIDHIEGLVKAKGTAADSYFDRYVLSYQLSGNPAWTTLKESASPVSQEILGSLDTTSIADGTSVIFKLAAYDKAGNIREAYTTNKVINSTDYLLSGVSVDRDYVTTNSGSIRFRLKDAAAVTVKLKDSAGSERTVYNASTAAGYKTVDIGTQIGVMAEGYASFTVSAALSGKTTSAGGNFTVDKTAPVLSLAGASPAICGGRTFDIPGSISEANPDYYRVIVNGETTNIYQTTNGDILSTVALPEDETYNVVLSAFDKAGNSSEQSMTVTADRSVPVCFLEKPQEDERTGKTLKIKGNIYDEHLAKYEIYLNENKIYTSPSVLNGELSLDTSSYQGKAVLKAICYDSAGNISSVTRNITIDNNPPSTFMTIGGRNFSDVVYPLNGTNFISGSLTFNLQAISGDAYSVVTQSFVSLDGGTFSPFQTANVAIHFDSGWHTASYYSIDDLGNAEAVKSSSIMVDNNPPAIRCRLNPPYINDGTNVYIPFDNRVELIAADDLSGLSLAYYSVDNGKSWNTYSALESSGITLINPGTNEVLYYAVDQVGNASTNAAERFFMDPAPPFTVLRKTGSCYEDHNDIYYKGNLRASLLANDYGSGVAHTYYSLNGSQMTESTNPPVFTGTEDKLEFYSVDKLDNEESPQIFKLIKDENPPDISLNIIGKSFTNSAIYALPAAQIVISALDKLSGLKDIYYLTGGDEFSVSSNNISLISETNTISYYAEDNLGNSTATNLALIILDGEAPHSDISLLSGRVMDINGRKYCKPGSVFKITSTDRLCGIKSCNVFSNGNPVQSDQVSISAGTNTIGYFAVDNLGNTELTNNFTVISPIPDTTPPVLSVYCNGFMMTTNGRQYGNTNLSISISANDPEKEGEFASGVTEIRYEINGQWNITNKTSFDIKPISGLNNISIYAADQMGNTSSTNQLLIVIDSEPPVTTCNNTNQGWNKNPVTLEFPASDAPVNSASGTAATFIRYNDNTMQTNSILVDSEGRHTIEFYSIDNVSNREAAKTTTVNIDYSAPEIIISGIQKGQNYNGKGVIPTLDCSDITSGISSLAIKVLKDNLQLDYLETNLNGSPGFSFTNNKLTNEGLYIFTVSASDMAGNLTTSSVAFNIDTTPPATPGNIRHLFDGKNVYLEWDVVKNTDLYCYNVYRNSNFIISSTNSYLIDEYANNGIYTYEISAEDRSGNVSGKSRPEIVNTSPLLLFEHPSTNVYFQNKMWVRTDYKEKNGRPSKYLGFNSEETNELRLFEKFSSFINEQEKKSKGHNNRLKDVILDTALSNSFVPTNFINLYDKNRLNKSLNKNIDISEMEEGSYALRIRGSRDGWPQFEDVAWFGIDNTPPVTCLVVNSNVIITSDHLEVPEHSTITLKAFDPVVNGTFSDIGSTYYKIHGRRMHTHWKKYKGEKISLDEGTYIISYMTKDKAHYLFEDNETPNSEKLKSIEIIAGNYNIPLGGSITNNSLPDIELNGIQDYGSYNGSISFDFQVKNAIRIKAKLDDKPVESPCIVRKPGDHHLRIEAVNESGNINVRDVWFKVVKE